MKYQIGELYYDSMLGLICVTELKSVDIFSSSPFPSNIFSNSTTIGKFVRLSDNREISLTDRKQYNIATDAEIIEFITNQMLYFKISDKASVALYKDCDLVYIGDDTNTVAIHRDDIAAIITLLQRECNL